MSPRESAAVHRIRSSASTPVGKMMSGAFFDRCSDEVAGDLIGKIVWRRGFGGGRLTEVEAYLPKDDPASHAWSGRTQRNGAMFGPAGRLYVFLSYGVHHLLNLVCDHEGVGAAVLIRSFEPITDVGSGGTSDGACGPGIVGRLLGIEMGMDGMELGAESGVYVLDDGMRPQVGRTARVGITRGSLLPLRYYNVGSRYVSGPSRMIEGR